MSSSKFSLICTICQTEIQADNPYQIKTFIEDHFHNTETKTISEDKFNTKFIRIGSMGLKCTYCGLEQKGEKTRLTPEIVKFWTDHCCPSMEAWIDTQQDREEKKKEKAYIKNEYFDLK